MKITAPGFYDIPAQLYHADPCPAPSLSHSIAKVLLQQSPRHAKHAHPRLTPPEPEDFNQVTAAGSALHKLVFGKGEEIAIIPFDDYKKAQAKELRDQAIGANLIPILAEKMPDIIACAKAAEEQIRQHPDLKGFYEPAAESEIVIAWQEGPVWCRSMIDRRNHPQIFDLKTTKLSANPQSWERRLQTEYATQDAFYRRGLRALGAKFVPPLLFIVIEQDAPFGLSVLSPDSFLQQWADAEVEDAVSQWQACLATGEWPGYPREIHYVTVNKRQQDEMEFGAATQNYAPKPSARALSAAMKEFS